MHTASATQSNAIESRFVHRFRQQHVLSTLSLSLDRITAKNLQQRPKSFRHFHCLPKKLPFYCSDAVLSATENGNLNSGTIFGRPSVVVNATLGFYLHVETKVGGRKWRTGPEKAFCCRFTGDHFPSVALSPTWSLFGYFCLIASQIPQPTC